MLGGLVYLGNLVLSITGDKIDSGKLVQLAERSLEELKLDQLVADWQQILLENLEDPFTQDSLGLLPPASKKLIDAFLTSRKLPDPLTTEFANAVQEALSGLEKIAVKGDEIKQALQALRHLHERALQGQRRHQAALRD